MDLMRPRPNVQAHRPVQLWHPSIGQRCSCKRLPLAYVALSSTLDSRSSPGRQDEVHASFVNERQVRADARHQVLWRSGAHHGGVERNVQLADERRNCKLHLQLHASKHRLWVLMNIDCWHRIAVMIHATLLVSERATSDKGQPRPERARTLCHTRTSV